MKTLRKLELAFSGGPNRWFDLWHTHADWGGRRHWGLEQKGEFLVELFGLYRIGVVKAPAHNKGTIVHDLV